jgi:hypothetical protein
MKKLTKSCVLSPIMALTAISLLASSVARADAIPSITISNADFNDVSLVGTYNGTYDASPVGHIHLDYAGPDDYAVVGAKGPFGTLAHGSMSFDFANLTGDNGVGPYAIFGVSASMAWNSSAQRFLIFALAGNQLNSNTHVHIFDINANADYTGVAYGSTLASILNVTYNGVDTFGSMVVMRAYAGLGVNSGAGTVVGSVDINAVTVTSTPEPRSLFAVFGAALVLFAGVRRKLTA